MLKKQKINEIVKKIAALVMREPFNYTKWQEHLWENLTVEKISKKAMMNRKNV